MGSKYPIIHLATDHAGYILKEAVAAYLRRAGYNVVDHGAFSAEPCDYPDYIFKAAKAVTKAKGRAMGIVFGGSGIGECIAANKVRGIRAALAYDAYTARVTREHNDSNILCLGGRTATGDPKVAKRLARIWLTTPFSGAARHRRRLKKIADRER